MEENDVKSTCGGTRLEYKTERDEKFSIQNVTRKIFCSKSDKTKKTF